MTEDYKAAAELAVRMERITANAEAQAIIDKARKKGLPVRFYYLDFPDDEILIDAIEIDQATFFKMLEDSPHFTEQWHTMWENGSDQVTLTIDIG